MNQILELEALKAALEKGTKTSPLPWVDPYAHTGRANIIAWDLSDEEAVLATLAVNSLPALIEAAEEGDRLKVGIEVANDVIKDVEAEVERLRVALEVITDTPWLDDFGRRVRIARAALEHGSAHKAG